MTQEQKQDIISTRGLQEGGEPKTPLREFSGVLDSYYPEDRFGTTRVFLNFKDVEVVESVEPYNFPTAVIDIKFSNKKNSAWGGFADSLNSFLAEGEDVKDTVGLRYTMKMEVAHIYGKDRVSGLDMVGDQWHVTELEGHIKQEAAVEGVAPVSTDTPAEAEAKKLLDGKTLAQFNKEAYASAVIRKDVPFQRTITDKSFTKAMLAVGEFSVDENQIYHRAVVAVEAPVAVVRTATRKK